MDNVRALWQRFVTVWNCKCKNEFMKGLFKENPVLVGLLGMCPSLAVTTMAVNGIGMGLATTFVLVCSNVVISLLKNVIPKAVRLPGFIVIIASFVTFVGFILKGYIPALYDALGLYLSLITVNCIILGRAEVFASKSKPGMAALDGLGMGLGFTLALFVLGSVRELFGTGSWMGINITISGIEPMLVFILPAGGFFVLGIIIAAVNRYAGKLPPQNLGCEACPMADFCSEKPDAVSSAEPALETPLTQPVLPVQEAPVPVMANIASRLEDAAVSASVETEKTEQGGDR